MDYFNRPALEADGRICREWLCPRCDIHWLSHAPEHTPIPEIEYTCPVCDGPLTLTDDGGAKH